MLRPARKQPESESSSCLTAPNKSPRARGQKSRASRLAGAAGSAQSARVESPKLELGQGKGLPPWCPQEAQFSMVFVSCSGHHVSRGRAQRGGTLVAPVTQRGGLGRHIRWDGHIQPPRHRHPHLAQPGEGKAGRTGHAAPSHKQLRTSWDKQQSHCGLRGSLQALGGFQEPRWVGVLIPFPALSCSSAKPIASSAEQGRRTASLASFA